MLRAHHEQWCPFRLHHSTGGFLIGVDSVKRLGRQSTATLCALIASQLPNFEQYLSNQRPNAFHLPYVWSIANRISPGKRVRMRVRRGMQMCIMKLTN
jgi:hypothetical protein